MNILSLNDDDLIEIFNYLEYADLESLFFTCQRFSAIVEQYFFAKLSAQLSVCPSPSPPSSVDPYTARNLIPFESHWDRIELNKRWTENIYRIQYRKFGYPNASIQCESDRIYISNHGEIRQHRRTVENWYSDDYVSIGRENQAAIASFVQRNGVLITGSLVGTCSIFVDNHETTAINQLQINKSKEAIRFVDTDGRDYFITATPFDTKEWRLDSEWGLYDLVLVRHRQPAFVTCLRIWPDGKRYFQAKAVEMAIIDRETGSDLQVLQGEADMALDVVWPAAASPDTLLTAHRDGSLRMFDIRESPQCRTILPSPFTWNMSLQMISPWTVICGYQNNHVTVFDLRMPYNVVTTLGPYLDERLKRIAADSHHLHIATDSHLISLDFNAL